MSIGTSASVGELPSHAADQSQHFAPIAQDAPGGEDKQAQTQKLTLEAEKYRAKAAEILDSDNSNEGRDPVSDRTDARQVLYTGLNVVLSPGGAGPRHPIAKAIAHDLAPLITRSEGECQAHMQLCSKVFEWDESYKWRTRVWITNQEGQHTVHYNCDKWSSLLEMRSRHSGAVPVGLEVLREYVDISPNGLLRAGLTFGPRVVAQTFVMNISGKTREEVDAATAQTVAAAGNRGLVEQAREYGESQMGVIMCRVWLHKEVANSHAWTPVELYLRHNEARELLHRAQGSDQRKDDNSLHSATDVEAEIVSGLRYLLGMIGGEALATSTHIETGNTLLHDAALLGSSVLVTELVGLGFDRQALNNDGKTPAMLAMANGHISTLADLDSVWLSDQLITYITRDDMIDFTLLLQGADMDVNQCGSNGATPLAVAVKLHRIAMVELLVRDYEASLDVTDERGVNIMLLITEIEDRDMAGEMLALMLEHGIAQPTTLSLFAKAITSRSAAVVTRPLTPLGATRPWREVAVKLQSVVRGHNGRKTFLNARIEREAAMKAAEERRQLESSASGSLRRVYRGHLVRKRMAQIREDAQEHLAAIAIVRAKQTTAVLILQRVTRGHSSRKRSTELVKRARAVIEAANIADASSRLLQRVWRGHVGRKLSIGPRALAVERRAEEAKLKEAADRAAAEAEAEARRAAADSAAQASIAALMADDDDNAQEADMSGPSVTIQIDSPPAAKTPNASFPPDKLCLQDARELASEVMLVIANTALRQAEVQKIEACAQTGTSTELPEVDVGADGVDEGSLSEPLQPTDATVPEASIVETPAPPERMQTADEKDKEKALAKANREALAKEREIGANAETPTPEATQTADEKAKEKVLAKANREALAKEREVAASTAALESVAAEAVSTIAVTSAANETIAKEAASNAVVMVVNTALEAMTAVYRESADRHAKTLAAVDSEEAAIKATARAAENAAMKAKCDEAAAVAAAALSDARETAQSVMSGLVHAVEMEVQLWRMSESEAELGTIDSQHTDVYTNAHGGDGQPMVPLALVRAMTMTEKAENEALEQAQLVIEAERAVMQATNAAAAAKERALDLIAAADPDGSLGIKALVKVIETPEEKEVESPMGGNRGSARPHVYESDQLDGETKEAVPPSDEFDSAVENGRNGGEMDASEIADDKLKHADDGHDDVTGDHGSVKQSRRGAYNTSAATAVISESITGSQSHAAGSAVDIARQKRREASLARMLMKERETLVSQVVGYAVSVIWEQACCSIDQLHVLNKTKKIIASKDSPKRLPAMRPRYEEIVPGVDYLVPAVLPGIADTRYNAPKGFDDWIPDNGEEDPSRSAVATTAAKLIDSSTSTEATARQQRWLSVAPPAWRVPTGIAATDSKGFSIPERDMFLSDYGNLMPGTTVASLPPPKFAKRAVPPLRTQTVHETMQGAELDVWKKFEKYDSPFSPLKASNVPELSRGEHNVGGVRSNTTAMASSKQKTNIANIGSSGMASTERVLKKLDRDDSRALHRAMGRRDAVDRVWLAVHKLSTANVGYTNKTPTGTSQTNRSSGGKAKRKKLTAKSQSRGLQAGFF